MNEATTIAIVPVKALRDAKSRLAGELAPSDRQRLVLAMLDDVLVTLAACHGVVRTLVVTLDEAVATLARVRHAEVLWEVGPASLNGALRQAIADVVATGGRSVLIVPGDLPLLTTEDIDAVLLAGGERAQQGGRIAIAPSRDERGTNALLIEPPQTLQPAFGPDSFAAHQKAALLAGQPPHIVRSAGLAFDIDTPDDLQELRQVKRYSWLGQAPQGLPLKRATINAEVTR